MAPTAGTRLRFKAAHAKKPFQKPRKLPSLKNRIRALERFLKRGGINDEVRATKQRELEELQQQHGEKLRVEEAKKVAEKTKKPRFFERVKLMRKLKKTQSLLDKETGKKERHALEKEHEQCRQDLIYLFYYPKTEPYLSLFPAEPHDEKTTQRQQELRSAALERFEQEKPEEEFHRFCYPDKQGAPSNVPVLSKKLSKVESDKKKKKSKSRNEGGKIKKQGTVTQHVHADVDSDDDDMQETGDQNATEGDEEDDFFL